MVAILLFSAVFVLVLPTLNDIMTAYIQNLQPYLQLSNGIIGLIPENLAYCIHYPDKVLRLQ
jgi:hypothetical protein